MTNNTAHLTKCNTCETHAPEEQMTQIEGFSGPYVCEYCWLYN